MTRVLQNWEGGAGATPGVQIAPGNTGGPGNTPVVAAAAGLSYSTDIVHSGTFSAKLVQPSGSTAYCTIPVAPSLEVRSVYRLYIYHQAFTPSSAFSLGGLYIGSSTQVAGLYALADGTIGFGKGGNHGTGVLVPTGKWVRYELGLLVSATAANDTIDLSVFVGDSTTPISSSGPISDSGLGTAVPTSARLGSGTTTYAYDRTSYVDDFAFDDNMPSGLIGPSVVASGIPDLSGLGLGYAKDDHEFAYFSANSGLTPPANFTKSGHKKAYYENRLGVAGQNLDLDALKYLWKVSGLSYS